MIVSGSASQALAARLARELDVSLAEVAFDRFPDGELLAAVPDFSADRAVIVASTVSSDAHLELLQLQDAVREAGAETVLTVLPYMGYARQDAAFDAGHPVSARAVARAISTGSDAVLTVTPHERGVCDYFDPPATAIAFGSKKVQIRSSCGFTVRTRSAFVEIALATARAETGWPAANASSWRP